MKNIFGRTRDQTTNQSLNCSLQQKARICKFPDDLDSMYMSMLRNNRFTSNEHYMGHVRFILKYFQKVKTVSRMICTPITGEKQRVTALY